MIQRIHGIAAAIGLIAAFGLSAPSFAQQPVVDKFVLSDTIQPVTQGELDRAIARANSDGALIGLMGQRGLMRVAVDLWATVLEEPRSEIAGYQKPL